LEEANIAHLIFRTNSLDKKSLWKTSDRNASIRLLTLVMSRNEDNSGDTLLVSTVNVAPPSQKNALEHNTIT